MPSAYQRRILNEDCNFIDTSAIICKLGSSGYRVGRFSIRNRTFGGFAASPPSPGSARKRCVRLQRLLQQNPLRTDFQKHYEEIVAEYNREKDRATIEQTFEALLRLVQEIDEEDSRAVREGLDEESLAIFDLLKKDDLTSADIKWIKGVAVDLLVALKSEKLRVDQWRDKEATRDSVRVTIRDFLWSDVTGLPVDQYTEADVQARADEVFRHVYRAYPPLHPIINRGTQSGIFIYARGFSHLKDQKIFVDNALITIAL